MRAKGVALVLGVVFAVVVLAVAGWQFGWFVKEKNVDRRVGIDNRNLGTQTAWRDEATKTVSDYELVDRANGAARGALRIKACGLIGRLTVPYRDDQLVVFQERECR